MKSMYQFNQKLIESKLILLFLTIILATINFNIVAYPSKIHCATKEMSDKYKSEIRLRVYYHKTHKDFNIHAYGHHDSADPIDDSSDAPHEDPGSGNSFCYPVQDFNNNLTDVNKLIDFRIDVKHAGDCKNWKLSDQQNDFVAFLDVDEYQYDDSTQTYALRHYHFGVHTHCKLRSKTYATTN